MQADHFWQARVKAVRRNSHVWSVGRLGVVSEEDDEERQPGLPSEMICNLICVCAALLEAYCCSDTIIMRYELENIGTKLMCLIGIGKAAGMAHDFADRSVFHKLIGAWMFAKDSQRFVHRYLERLGMAED
jgi:hypothetical protein